MKIRPGVHARIVDGPFNHFDGVVLEVLKDQAEAVVEIQIFGRGTAVNVEFSQLEGYTPSNRNDAHKHLRRLCLRYCIHRIKKWWLQRCLDYSQPDDPSEEYAMFLKVYRLFENDSKDLLRQFAAEYPADMSDETFAARWRTEERKWLARVAFDPLPDDELLKASSQRQEDARQAFQAREQKPPGER